MSVDFFQIQIIQSRAKGFIKLLLPMILREKYRVGFKHTQVKDKIE